LVVRMKKTNKQRVIVIPEDDGLRFNVRLRKTDILEGDIVRIKMTDRD
jgi:hypothetical protein